MDMLSDDRVIDAIVSMVMVLQDQENTSLPLLERQLQEADSAIENMLNAIQQGILTRSTKTRLEELEASRDNLEAQIALEKMAKPRITEEQVRYFLKRFRKLDVAKLEHRKILIDIFLSAIYIYNDHMDIAFNYKEGTKTINFSDMECALSKRASAPGSDLELSPVPRQKNSVPFRFRGFRKSRENCTSTESFFLSKSEVSRGISDLVYTGVESVLVYTSAKYSAVHDVYENSKSGFWLWPCAEFLSPLLSVYEPIYNHA